MTCIPKEGIYMFSEERLNYTNAILKCEKYGGKLVNINTEESTNRATNVITKSKMNKNKLLMAYAGLNDISQEGKFITVNGKKIN